MAARRAKSKTNKVVIEDYEHSTGRRTNNPPAGLAHLDREETPVRRYAYDPHLDPQLQWTGKEEAEHIDVPAPSVHVHEEISAERILGSVRKQRTQVSLFDLEALDPDKAIEFYQHDMGWTNRLVLGDSLLVMNSLLERERLGDKVQTIFIDPPYGVNYRSNFQPTVTNTNPAEGKDASLTREPEMIQAYRDTWELGIHSYLTYLRDRLMISRELLTDSGSIFVQISVDNAHLVRTLLDEVFGAHNHVNTITFLKTSSAGSPGALRNLPTTADFILWYAKDKNNLKYRQPFQPKSALKSTADAYIWIELPDGTRRRKTKAEKAGDPLPEGARVFRLDNLTSQSGVDKTRYPIKMDGKEFRPGKAVWKTSEQGMERLVAQRRVIAPGKKPYYVRYIDDFAWAPFGEVWTDTVTSGYSSDKRYVVQTNPKPIERCILMTTDPGDLVIDPTCGSGTTAIVCEDYGRRWITIDTSRVAVAVARERILTTKFDFYKLADENRGVDGGLVYETAKRVTLRSIARGEGPEEVVLHDRPQVDTSRVRVSGPFTVEALSRYAENPLTPSPAPTASDATDHVRVLLEAMEKQGVPRPGREPLAIQSLTQVASAGRLQAEGTMDTPDGPRRIAVSLGPRFGAITMSQVSEALREAVGYDLVVFAGFSVDVDTQSRLSTGKVGGIDVALLLANPDLLVGDLLKNTSTSQTFRLFSSPDVEVSRNDDGYVVVVNGVDSYDAATGEVSHSSKQEIVAWFVDDDYDSTVFRATQAFFPVSNGWEKLQAALRGSVDEEAMSQLHEWESLPFERGEHGRCAVRVVTSDGNAAEALLELPA